MSKRKTIKIDALGQVPGRLATQIATILMGKDKATYAPHLDAGSIVKIANVGKVKFTGKKIDQKLYRHHSNHPGGLKEIPAKKMLAENPERIIIRAVEKMLPKNKLRDLRMARLKFE
ncbi:MAG: 50S ribosomal protein L13 [Candidatus Magasanikbacteria bacterium]